MKHQGCWALGLGILTLALVASPAAAQTTANGPYYATASWDQTLPSSTRFIVLSNLASAAVLDRETGLVWERSPRSAVETIELGSASCLTATTGNRAGWRLPTVNELASLFDPSQTSIPFLPPGHPFTGVPLSGNTFFWSATPAVSQIDHHLSVSYTDFPITALFLHSVASDGAVAIPWCVRGGLLAEPQ